MIPFLSLSHWATCHFVTMSVSFHNLFKKESGLTAIFEKTASARTVTTTGKNPGGYHSLMHQRPPFSGFDSISPIPILKEALRSIYRTAHDSFHARLAFLRWCKAAERSEISEMKTMARTIRDKLDGIVSFWTFRHISNAQMEGFNNKIRWLIKQAYGFRDREYFKLKIYQLPEISSTKEI